MLRKTNRGITLVALVITIVILLILAGISISTLTNTGIFQRAKDAKQKSENSQKEEDKLISEYEKRNCKTRYRRYMGWKCKQTGFDVGNDGNKIHRTNR